jgi:hypothetical protein
LNVLEPAALYGDSYGYRTKNSGTAQAAITRFLDFIGVVPGVDTVIDIGASDGYLLSYSGIAHKVAVDPHAEIEDGDAVRALFENAALSSYQGRRKLFVASHTLEHVPDVDAFLSKISGLWRDGDKLAISVPSLDLMVAECRMDWVHHQHVQYFSERSLGLLLAKHGFGILKSQFDHQHWGALMLLCDRKVRGVKAESMNKWTISRAHTEFEHMISEVSVPKGAIGFGAGPMVPVLRYHLPALENIAYIADNDRSKNGLRYTNFDKSIRADYDLADRDVVITAVTSKLSARALTAQAFERGARNVIVPVKVL